MAVNSTHFKTRKGACIMRSSFKRIFFFIILCEVELECPDFITTMLASVGKDLDGYLIEWKIMSNYYFIEKQITSGILHLGSKVLNKEAGSR